MEVSEELRVGIKTPEGDIPKDGRNKDGPEGEPKD
jgi:hypothetical protein